MPFIDTPNRAIIELDVNGAPAGRYQKVVHRVLEEDPTFAREVTLDLTAAEFAAIFDNASVSLSGQVQALNAANAALQAQNATLTTERDAARSAVAIVRGADDSWNQSVRPAIDAAMPPE
jgi:hypothetical protein